MREYHIYMQRTKRTEWHCDYSIYKWLPWEYVGYVEGTKELYTYFKLKFPYSMRSINLYHSFNYFDDEYLKIDNNWDFMCTCPREYHRYLIMVMYETFINLLRNIKRNTIVRIINIMVGIFIGLQQCRISVKVLHQKRL